MNRLPAVQHFIYPLSSSSGFLLGESTEMTPENYWRRALRGGTDEWGLAYGYQLIEPGDWVWAYFGGPIREVCGVGEVVGGAGWREDWERHSVKIRWNVELTGHLRDDPIQYDSYRQQVQGAAVRANPETLRVFGRWLRTQRVSVPEESRHVKFAKRAVQARLGQPQFRSAVLRAFRGTCSISGCTEQSVLQAAHIRGVTTGGSHDVANSILLRADLHNLFDLGLLTIGLDLSVHIDSSIRDRTYRSLQGRKASPPRGVSRSQWAGMLAS